MVILAFSSFWLGGVQLCSVSGVPNEIQALQLILFAWSLEAVYKCGTTNGWDKIHDKNPYYN